MIEELGAAHTDPIGRGQGELGLGRFGVALVLGAAAEPVLVHGQVVLPGLVILLSGIALGLRHARLLISQLDCILVPPRPKSAKEGHHSRPYRTRASQTPGPWNLARGL